MRTSGILRQRASGETFALHTVARQSSTRRYLSISACKRGNSSANNVPTTDTSPQLTHLDSKSNAQMVTIDPSKPITNRLATATCTLRFSNLTTLPLIKQAAMKKGDVLSVSRLAGIMGAKKCSDLIPLCHNIPLSGVDVQVEAFESDKSGVVHGLEITATAKTMDRTGVEMEALTAATVAGLTAYDMCKAVDKGMVLGDVRVVRKEGGKSGTWVEGEKVDEEI